MSDVQKLMAALALGGALVSAGMWAGNLAARVAALEEKDSYIHGTFDVPENARR